MKKLIEIYLTPIVFMIWAAWLYFGGDAHTVIRLVSIAVALAIQFRALRHRYKENRENHR